MINYFEFSLIIKERRIAKGVRQKDICNLIPMTYKKYNRIENGLTEPTFYELISICKILDIDITKEIKKNEAINTPHFD